MFHLSREPMALLGLDARFWDVNQALADTVQLQPQQLCCGISLLSLVLPEDLDSFLHHARSLLSAGEGVEPCHVKFPCRIRSNDDSIIDIEFDLHMLRRASSPYCFALYLRPRALKAEALLSTADAALSINSGMFLLEQLQQQQQQQQQQHQQHQQQHHHQQQQQQQQQRQEQQQLEEASSSGASFMLEGLQQQDAQAGSMFLPGDFHQQQLGAGMFMPAAADASSPLAGAFH
jgi:hypothetical protein